MTNQKSFGGSAKTILMFSSSQLSIMYLKQY